MAIQWSIPTPQTDEFMRDYLDAIYEDTSDVYDADTEGISPFSAKLTDENNIIIHLTRLVTRICAGGYVEIIGKDGGISLTLLPRGLALLQERFEHLCLHGQIYYACLQTGWLPDLLIEQEQKWRALVEGKIGTSHEAGK